MYISFNLIVHSKALESLAGRESGEPQRVREQARREMDALRDAFNKRITDLEHVSLKYLLSFSVSRQAVGADSLSASISVLTNRGGRGRQDGSHS